MSVLLQSLTSAFADHSAAPRYSIEFPDITGSAWDVDLLNWKKGPAVAMRVRKGAMSNDFLLVSPKGWSRPLVRA